MLFKQLVILNTIILVLLTGVFVSYNLSSINQLIENEVYGMFQTTMDSGEAELNETFEDARDLALELCASGTIQNILKKNGINATIRRPLGADINASCGQLRRLKNRGEN